MQFKMRILENMKEKYSGPINETMCKGVFSIKKGDTEWAEKSTARN